MTKIKLETKYGAVELTRPSDDMDLTEMLDLFQELLRGAGYYFDGSLQIAVDRNEVMTPKQAKVQKELEDADKF